jgi:hypothetical protein
MTPRVRTSFLPGSHSHSARSRRAVTLVELLIGLSITAVTCGILAVLINATAMGTSTQNDGRRALVRLQAVKAVLEDEFVNARCILATGSNYVCYWTGDSTGPTTVNNAVNFSELRMLAIDSSGNLNVYCCKWPSGTSNATILANDTQYALATDWRSTAEALRGTTYYSTNTLATGASALTISLDSASPSTAKLINLQVTLNDGSVARQLSLGVALANPVAPW